MMGALLKLLPGLLLDDDSRNLGSREVDSEEEEELNRSIRAQVI